MAGVKIAGQLLNWAMTIYVIRLLTPSDYGVMAIASMFVGLLSLLNEMGMGAALIQSRRLDDSILRQIFGLVIIINFCLCLVLFCSSPLIATFFDETRLKAIVRVLSFEFILMSFAVIPQSLLERELDFKRKSIVDFVANVGGGICTLWLAFLGKGVWSLVGGSVITVFFRTFGVNIISPFKSLPRFSFRGMRATISFGGLLTFERVLWYFYTQADIFIIGKVLGKEVLGFYSVAKHLSSLISQKVMPIINQVAFPAFSKIQNDKAKVAFYQLKAIRILSFIIFPVYFGIACVAPELVSLVLGEKWHAVALPLQILSLIMPIRMLNMLGHPVIIGLGRADVSFVNLLILSVLMPTAFLMGSNWGIMGICIAWLSVYPIGWFITLKRTLPIIGISLVDYFTAIYRSALSSFVMLLLVFGVRFFSTWALTPTENLVLLLVVGIATIAGLVSFVNRNGYSEIITLSREALRLRP